MDGPWPKPLGPFASKSSLRATMLAANLLVWWLILELVRIVS
jgi:hypothetical protein